jgi:LacI family transcriptional regulator
MENTGLPTVRPDEYKIGAVAAKHFMKTGLFRFALIRRRGDGWYQTARCRGFQETLRTAGYNCESYTQNDALASPEETERFSEWIRSLRPSIGIFLSDDSNAHNVIQTCHDAGLKVPRDIALIGSTNSPEVLNSNTLNISTVQYDLSELGYSAAHTLHKLMNGHAPASLIQSITPDHVAERDSTHAILFDSLEIRKSIGFLQENYTQSISIVSVADFIGMSRSSFYRLFVKEVKKTPHDYLQMLRVQRAQELLLSSAEACLEDVAVNCGFSGRKHLNQAFIKRTGLSASQWRTQKTRNGVS